MSVSVTERADAPRARGASREWIWTLILVVVALLPRLYVALVWAKEPVWDGHYYHFGAVRIAQGLGYSEDVFVHGVLTWKPWTHYPVGYSAWLALFYRILGPHTWVAPVANALVGAGLVAVVHRMAREALGLWRGHVAALLVALHPGLIAYSAVVMTEPLAGFLVTLAAWVVLRGPERLVNHLWAGAILTAAVLVRPSTLVAAPLLAFIHPRLDRRVLGRVAAACVICGVGVLPWTVRNCVRMDGCAFVSTNAGWNLAIGAISDTGRFQVLRANDGCPVVTGQVQQDRCWWDVGWRVIRERPLRWLSLVPKKLAQTFDHESFPVEYLHESDPVSWPTQRRTWARERLTDCHRALLVVASFLGVAWVGWSQRRSLAFWLQVGLKVGILTLLYWVSNHDQRPFFWFVVALLGLVLLPLPGRPRLGPLLRFSTAFVAATALTHAVFFGDDRYHVVTTGFFCIFAAAVFRHRSSPTPAAREPDASSPRSSSSQAGPLESPAVSTTS